MTDIHICDNRLIPQIFICYILSTSNCYWDTEKISVINIDALIYKVEEYKSTYKNQLCFYTLNNKLNR